MVLHGVDEAANEYTDQVVRGIISDKLGIQLEVFDIKNSHRLGKPNPQAQQRNTRSSRPGKVRPIIFRLTLFTKRMVIFKNKKKLKGTDGFRNYREPHRPSAQRL